ncbi:Clavaminate synthase-like protein [Massarina eburnea CBS 473.64]|uniref:Clavaminate synthase-like protein n=1 Tax=Massarina eburnea CBS 473.64 TaxID=1395130 RepID=A0A6A6RN45_9PLEO|nr:Clavaminate synthase-like protein [Massarina eburnea CBS 473.64]
MSATTTMAVEEPRYEFYYRENTWDNKRQVLTGSRCIDTFSEIPLVDISRIFSPKLEERKAVAQAITNVCQRVGFMYISNHGISQELVDKVFAMSAAFHAQLKEIKQECYTHNNKELRGWNEHSVNTPRGPVHGPRLKVRVAKKGSFLYSYEPDNDPVPPQLTAEQRAMCLGTYNQWPTKPDGFKETMLRYQRELLTLSRKLMQSIALGLGCEETYFDTHVTAPFVSIILQHYLPMHPDAEDPNSLGAHTDYETFTILNQDATGGLEVLNKNGIYIPAPYIPNTFVVNMGDFLERITNDKVVSTVHRVRNVSGRQRYSIPFFFSFNMDSDMGVIPSCASETNPAKYGPRNLFEFTKEMRARQKRKYTTGEKHGIDAN